MIVESPTPHSNLEGPISLKFHTRICSPPVLSRKRAAMVNKRKSQAEESSLVPLPGLIVDHVQVCRPKPKPTEVVHWS
jgi:hypothetical protein